MLTRSTRSRPAGADVAAEANKENATPAPPAKRLLGKGLLTKAPNATSDASAASTTGGTSALQLRTRVLALKENAVATLSPAVAVSSLALLGGAGAPTPSRLLTPKPAAVVSSPAPTHTHSVAHAPSQSPIAPTSAPTATTSAMDTVAPSATHVMSTPRAMARPASPSRPAPPMPCVAKVAATPAAAVSSATVDPSAVAAIPAASPSSSSASTALAPGSTLVICGISYVVVSLLGSGGSATVWRVRAPDGALRAVKVMRLPGGNTADAATARPKHFASFEREVDILRTLTNDAPGAVAHMIASEVIDDPSDSFSSDSSSTSGGRTVYIVMQLGGPSLQQFIAAHYPRRRAAQQQQAPLPHSPPPDIVVRAVFHSLLSCVARVHAAGIAHLDLKPANFVCAPHPESSGAADAAVASPAPRLDLAHTFALIDFGIARRVDATAAATENAHEPACDKDEELLGTLNYMAPEFFAAVPSPDNSSSPADAVASPPGQPADIWALGVLLFSLLFSGRTPFGHLPSARPADERRKMLAIKHSTTDSTGSSNSATSTASTTDLPSATNPFCIAFPSSSLACEDANDLLRRCLANAPAARPTAAEVLSHPYLTLASRSSTPPPAAAPASPISLPAGTFLITAAQVHALIATLANSTFSATKLREHEERFLHSLATSVEATPTAPTATIVSSTANDSRDDQRA